MQIRETPKNVKMEEKKNSPKKHQKTQKKSTLSHEQRL